MVNSFKTLEYEGLLNYNSTSGSHTRRHTQRHTLTPHRALHRDTHVQRHADTRTHFALPGSEDPNNRSIRGPGRAVPIGTRGHSPSGQGQDPPSHTGWCPGDNLSIRARESTGSPGAQVPRRLDARGTDPGGVSQSKIYWVRIKLSKGSVCRISRLRKTEQI